MNMIKWKKKNISGGRLKEEMKECCAGKLHKENKRKQRERMKLNKSDVAKYF